MSGQVLSKGFQGRGISAFGEIEHLALGGISDQGQVRMSSLRRGLVNRHRSHFRQVRGVDGQVDILGENGLYPMPGFAHESGHGPKRNLPGQHQDQRLEQQGEPLQVAGPLGLAQHDAAVRQPKTWHPDFQR
jgi:hypothetical protein